MPHPVSMGGLPLIHTHWNIFSNYHSTDCWCHTLPLSHVEQTTLTQQLCAGWLHSPLTLIVLPIRWWVERCTQLRLAHLSSNKILPIRRQTETRDWLSVWEEHNRMQGFITGSFPGGRKVSRVQRVHARTHTHTHTLWTYLSTVQEMPDSAILH